MKNHCCFRWKQYLPLVKADFLRDFSSLPAASNAPSSLFKGALASVFIRLKTSTLPTEVSKRDSKLLPQQAEVSQRGSIFFSHYYKQKYPPSPAKVFIAEIP